MFKGTICYDGCFLFIDKVLLAIKSIVMTFDSMFHCYCSSVFYACPRFCFMELKHYIDFTIQGRITVYCHLNADSLYISCVL